MKNLLILIVLGVFLLSGCAGHYNTVGGATLGGIGGGIAGSQIGKGTGNVAAIIGGTLIGAAIGGYVGHYMDRMDRVDKVQLSQTLERSPTGTQTQWANPDTRTQYTVTPVRTYTASTPTREYCREYNIDINVGGRSERGYGTACRQPDGSWKIIN